MTKLNRADITFLVVSLPQATERRRRIDARMRKFGFDYRIVDGLDGESYSEAELKQRFGERAFAPLPFVGRMSRGAVGAAASHLRVYDLIIDQNIPVACVLEDDAEPLDDIEDALGADAVWRADWEVLLLGHLSWRAWSRERGAETALWKTRVKNSRYRITRPAEFPFGAHGYLIKNGGARKLKKYGLPVRMPADWLTGNAELAGARLKVIAPPCIAVGEFASSIAKADADDRRPIRLARVLYRLAPRFKHPRYKIKVFLTKIGLTPTAYTRKV